jgi:hypothetical protein
MIESKNKNYANAYPDKKRVQDLTRTVPGGKILKVANAKQIKENNRISDLILKDLEKKKKSD